MGDRVQARKSMNKNGDEFRKCLVRVGTGQKQCWASLGHFSWLVSLMEGRKPGLLGRGGGRGQAGGGGAEMMNSGFQQGGSEDLMRH